MNRRQFLGLGAAAALTPLVKFAPAPAPAFAEGSVLPSPLPSAFPLHGRGLIHVGYRNAVEGYEHVYPLLYQATRHMRPATSPRIEWSRPNGKVEHNFTQIVRTPFGVTGTERALQDDFESMMRRLRKDALHSHLTDVEQTLMSGNRSRSNYWGTCGGVRCFGAGEMTLRPLRDLVLMTDRQRLDEDRYTEEYLGEFSLQVG